ncbi:MAG: nucleotide exchange factor GrpE [Planctomycetaceae bacterium]
MPVEHQKPEAAAHETGPGGEDAGADTLEQQLAAALAERDANYQRLLRAQADFDNSRKRAQREADEERKFAVLPVVRDILPALDNLRRAVDAARPVAEASNLVHGIDLVLQQVEQTFGKYGVTPIAAVGQPFDPHLHEAVTQMPSPEHPPMTVLQELERGYKLHDRVIRPGKVIVSQAPTT